LSGRALGRGLGFLELGYVALVGRALAEALAASSAASFANACGSVVGVVELLMAAMVILLARKAINAAFSKY
jgi:hypothetical protein